MNEEELLVIKCNLFMRPKEMTELYKYVRESRELGTIILPPYCEAIVVPKDIEIKFEGEPYAQHEK